MTSRLIALVMLPVTAMCLLAGSAVLSHRTATLNATNVHHGVDELDDLVELLDALHVLQSVEAFDVRFEQLGISRSDASAFLGFDVAAQELPARIAAAAAITTLGSHSPITLEAMQSLYSDLDGGVISATGAAGRLRVYERLTDDDVKSALSVLGAEAPDPSLINTLASVDVAIDLHHLPTMQMVDLSAIWFPSAGDTHETASATLARFGAESARYRAAADRLRELGVSSIVADLDRIESDPEVQAFERAVDATLSGKSVVQNVEAIDIEMVVATISGFFERDALLNDLVHTALTEVRDEARLLAASERTRYQRWALGAGALALVSIVIALRLARSISKPLIDLAGYAHAVNDGDLEADPSPSRARGPHETRVAFEVFTDLVANLQLLDGKANALARCDFDDPVLLEPLPGRLGRSLESSVAVLSGSIVERDELQTHLAHEATHDSLTGICNRPAAVTAIEAAMRRADRTGATIALLYVDLNQFKAINDSHGHEVGDEVLRQVATRIADGLRGGDIVARLGGDEFVVVAEGVAGVAGATDLARRLIDTIEQPIEVGASNVSVGAAVGIALTLDGPEEPLRLLARADAAMYRAKHDERSAIEIFDADLQREMMEREDIEAALTTALADPAGGGLHLHYQPVLDAASGAMAGSEALIRWNRAGHGVLAPDSFIPIAEATALIIDLDCWVLTEATRQLAAWSTVDGLADVPVAVNISGRHLLSRQLSGHISAVLDQSGVDPHRLSIEITETVLLTDLVSAAAELDAVRALGVRVAIDDFGTGYTSLAHLQQLPIDTIKIDRSFISQLNVRRGSSLVRMVTDLGHAIDINIVAEGVETGEEMSALQAMGADHLQGFLLSRPLEPAALCEWAQSRLELAVRA